MNLPTDGHWGPQDVHSGLHRETDRDAQGQSLDFRLPNSQEDGENHL